MTRGHTPRRRARRASAALGTLAVAVPLLWATSDPPVEVPFLDGLAWLGNSSRGEVAQVDGRTGGVRARLDGLDGEVNVSQVGDTVLVQVDGEVRRIDPGSLEWNEPLATDGELVVGEDLDGHPVAWLLHPAGRAESLDPVSLEITSETALSGSPGTGVVAPTGELVVPVRSAGTVDVEVVAVEGSVGTVTVGGNGDQARVSRVGDTMVALNVTSDDLHTLNLSRSRPRTDSTTALDLPDGHIVVPTNFPDGHLWLLAPRHGRLLAVDPDGAGVAGTTRVAAARSDLDGPVVLDDSVFVLDRSRNVLVEVDRTTFDELAVHELTDLEIEDPGDTELLVQDGRVFVNDRAGDTAVALTAGGDPVV
jgi:hypothetical protein